MSSVVVADHMPWIQGGPQWYLAQVPVSSPESVRTCPVFRGRLRQFGRRPASRTQSAAEDKPIARRSVSSYDGRHRACPHV
jgi:hypothetical protein